MAQIRWQPSAAATYSLGYTAHDAGQPLALLLIHPIGVGLDRRFWQRFEAAWGERTALFAPDLLGCGESDKPSLAYTPDLWADQIAFFTETVIRRPVVAVVQGALLPVALRLAQRLPLKGMVMAGPPTLEIMGRPAVEWQKRLSWSLFTSPLGTAFFQYARRQQFLSSFSQKQLFAEAKAVDTEWLNLLAAGSADLATRYAVFAFLAGFWREDYRPELAALNMPVLALFGEAASSISRKATPLDARDRLESYLAHLPQAQGAVLPGKNVLPYENTAVFAEAVAAFVAQLAAPTGEV